MRSFTTSLLSLCAIVPLAFVASAQDFCNSDTYREYMALSDYMPAQSYCYTYFPAPQRTATVYANPASSSANAKSQNVPAVARGRGMNRRAADLDKRATITQTILVPSKPGVATLVTSAVAPSAPKHELEEKLSRLSTIGSAAAYTICHCIGLPITTVVTLTLQGALSTPTPSASNSTVFVTVTVAPDNSSAAASTVVYSSSSAVASLGPYLVTSTVTVTVGDNSTSTAAGSAPTSTISACYSQNPPANSTYGCTYNFYCGYNYTVIGIPKTTTATSIGDCLQQCDDSPYCINIGYTNDGSNVCNIVEHNEYTQVPVSDDNSFQEVAVLQQEAVISQWQDLSSRGYRAKRWFAPTVGRGS